MHNIQHVERGITVRQWMLLMYFKYMGGAVFTGNFCMGIKVPTAF